MNGEARAEPRGGRPPRFAGLASRIAFFVFAATVVCAFTAALTRALALRTFLRSRVEGRIPEAAERAGDRLDLWFAQRTLDLRTFAHSEVLMASLGGGAREPRAEVKQYLGYVRDGFPLYAAIFVLDANGRVLAEAGTPAQLPSALRRELAATPEPRLSEVVSSRGGPVQIVSVPIPREAKLPMSLHATIPIAELRAVLVAIAGDSGDRIHVFDAQGALVASSLESFSGELPPALADAPAGRAVDCTSGDKIRVVASLRTLERAPLRVVLEADYGATLAPIAALLTRTAALNLAVVVVLAAAAYASARYLLRPLHALSDAAIRLRDGDTSVRIPHVTGDHEVGVLARSFAEMVESLASARETLEQLAITDGLTKIHNHRFFQDQLASAIRAAENAGAPLALILLDIDDFKLLNDRHGHTAGDRVLEDLALLLMGNARPRDLVARYGGEEFVVLAPGLSLAEGVALAEQIRLAVCSHEFRAGAAEASLRVTVSIGVADYQGDRARFFADADRALYSAKHSGKDCVVAASTS